MFIVGLTGGIGSGKTAVSSRFEALGINVVDADIAARVVVEPGTPALAKIEQYFGSDIINGSGELDRAKLRQKVFANDEQRAWLEALLHPLIGAEIFKELEASKSDYALFVSPLLIEAEQFSICDWLLVVDVSEETQLQRTIQRDNNDAEQVKAIMATQFSRQKRLKKADDVINNSGDLAGLDESVQKLHEKYLAMAAKKKCEKNAHE